MQPRSALAAALALAVISLQACQAATTSASFPKLSSDVPAASVPAAKPPAASDWSKGFSSAFPTIQGETGTEISSTVSLLYQVLLLRARSGLALR